jgi:hypothetical protein
MVSVEDDLVVDNLSDETQRGLGTVGVNGRHVQIVHEEYQMATSGGSEDLTRALVDVTLKDGLEGFGVGVRVKVHRGVDHLLGVEGGEVILQDSGLSGTGSTNVENTLIDGSMHIDDVALSSGFGSWHNQVLEESLEVGVEGLDLRVPWLVGQGGGVEEVVEAKTALRELDLAHGAHLVGERNLLLTDAGTEAPHEGEGEEAFVNYLQFLVELLGHFSQAL